VTTHVTPNQRAHRRAEHPVSVASSPFVSRAVALAVALAATGTAFAQPRPAEPQAAAAAAAPQAAPAPIAAAAPAGGAVRELNLTQLGIDYAVQLRGISGTWASRSTCAPTSW